MQTHAIESAVRAALRGISGGILVTVSGGADSMALLHAMCRCGIEVVAAHCNFHLRGEESMRDEQFVVSECQRLGVTLLTTDFDVPQYMATHGVTMEMACRDLRYDWFRKLRKEHRLARIATAHHRDDNIETMLLNMLRGSGPDGLKGMIPDTGEIIRPLLHTSRQEILDYLQTLGATYITDSSNLTTEPDRNFIRLKVLPLLRSRWQGADKGLAITQRNMLRANRICDHYLSDILGPNPDMADVEAILNSADPISAIHQLLKPHGANAAIEEEMTRALNSHSHEPRQWTLSDGYTALLQESTIRIYPPAKQARFRIIQTQSFANMSGDEKFHLRFRCRDLNRAYFCRPLTDYTIRSRRDGDKMRPIGMRGMKLVSDILKEAGVPLPYRADYPVMIDPDTDTIVWVPGCKRSAQDIITPHTEYAYEFQFFTGPDKLL
jgi:tRNA(Ile)-lysidine synthase